MPSVTGAIRDGFKAANKSWAGMGVYAAAWAVLIAVSAGGLMLTNPPQEIFEGEEAGMLDVATSDEAVADVGEAGDAAGPVGDDEGLRDQQIIDWLARAWPVALLCALALLLGSAWAQGGQLGYVAGALNGQPRVADFWAAGKTAFRAVLAAMALMLAADAALRIVNGMLDALFDAMATSAPQALLAVLALVLTIATLVPLIWLTIRVSFWFPAIVVGRLGPIAALKSSFQATRGRWWRVAGLRGLMLAIAFGAVLAYMALVALGTLLGEAIGGIVLVLGTIGLLVILLYGSFAFAAADIRYYEQARHAAA